MTYNYIPHILDVSIGPATYLSKEESLIELADNSPSTCVDVQEYAFSYAGNYATFDTKLVQNVGTVTANINILVQTTISTSTLSEVLHVYVTSTITDPSPYEDFTDGEYFECTPVTQTVAEVIENSYLCPCDEQCKVQVVVNCRTQRNCDVKICEIQIE